MSGKSRICEICGVRESFRGGFFARFPIDEFRCKTWVKLVGNEDLVHIPIEKLHYLRHICGDHFEKRDFGKSGKKLKKRAYPKLHLSAPPLSDHQMMDFPQHVASKNVPAANPTIPVESCPVVPMDSLPSTSRETASTSISQNLNVPAANPTIPVESCPVVPMESLPSTSRETASTSINQNINVDTRKMLVESFPAQAASAEPIPSTSREPLSNIQNINVSDVHPVSAAKSFPAQAAPAESKPRQAAPQNINDCKTTKEDLISQLKKVKSTIRSLKKNAKIMERLESPFLKEVVALALKNQKRKPRGHRWTTKYKIACLSILKRSPKAYKYLEHLVPVPSIKTLQNLLQKVPMEPGISAQILKHLSKVAASYKKDKYCCLLFDEVALKPRLNYNVRRDNVDGYTDMGKSERSNLFADHALVFMLQGIRRKFKQPVAFYFVKGTVSSQKLAEIVRKVVQKINETGFSVLATVCDQGPTNMGALKILRDSSPSEEGPSVKKYFHVNNKKIYVIYDVPHLFKSIRNNFMNYGVIQMDGKKGKWMHLKLVEERNRNLLYLSKITPNHTEPKYRAKMRVKNAAQALSTTVSAVLKLLALAENNPSMKKELADTGDIIRKLDQLFDCTNGPSGPDDVKPGQRQNVSKKTNHLEMWAQYRKIIETMSFNNEAGIRAKNVRCVQGYLITLCSLRDIWNHVQSLGFKYLNLRQLNQDALENLFGVLRQHSPTNKHPTVTSFVAALKTTIISGMSAPHSRGSNCQKDSNVPLTDLHSLIFGSAPKLTNEENSEDHVMLADNNKENEDGEHYTLHIPDEDDYEDETNERLLSIEEQPVVYLSGYLAMAILKNHNCTKCKESLTVANPAGDTYMYIKLREWWTDKSCLTYPQMRLCNYVDKCSKTFEEEIIPILHQCNISNQAVTLFICNSDGAFINCDLHRNKIFYSIASRLAVLLIRRQCKRINNKLAAHEENLADKFKKSQQYGMA